MERDEHLFVMRLWRETSVGGSAWRGSVEDVRAQQRLTFSKYADLVDFISLRTGMVEQSENVHRRRL